MKENMMISKISKTNGITLVALVVTIVVLIILATISVNLIFNEGGIIQKAQEAKKIQANATKYEQEQLGNLAEEMISKLPAEPITVTGDELKGAFIKYGVEYTDVYYNKYQYTSTNGWRLMDYKIDENDAEGKTLKEVKLISTGVPARMYYYYNDITNNYEHRVFDTSENKTPNLTTFYKKVLGESNYTIYSGGITASNYYGLQASAGYYYNLGKMTFTQGTLNTNDSTNRNKGSYIKVKNLSTDTTYESTTEDPTGNNLFIARSDASIRMLTLPELNKAVGRTTDIDNTSFFTDNTGLYELDKISTGTALTSNTYSNSGAYWLASPWPDENSNGRVCYVDCSGNISYNSYYYYGVRPVVTLTSNIQLTKRVDSNTKITYYEIVDVK